MLDADGLYAVKDRKELLRQRQEKGLVTILTPHEGEFAYLGGICPWAAGGRRFVSRKVRLHPGAERPATVTASPDGRVYINTTGNNGMAKGGSGDVLAGMVLSFWDREWSL